MPQIGWFEIIIIVALAIVIIGPKDLPIMLKKISSWVRSIKRYYNKLQEEVSLYDSEHFDSEDSINKKKKVKEDEKR
tara:strand:- start:19 stop:249 length:231 start_codon:yes stop_codon:yes gene_type:complete